MKEIRPKNVCYIETGNEKFNQFKVNVSIIWKPVNKFVAQMN